MSPAVLHRPPLRVAVLARTPAEAGMFTYELACHGILPSLNYRHSYGLSSFLRSSAFAAWYVDAALMDQREKWQLHLQDTLVTNGLIITFDREKLRESGSYKPWRGRDPVLVEVWGGGFIR